MKYTREQLINILDTDAIDEQYRLLVDTMQEKSTAAGEAADLDPRIYMLTAIDTMITRLKRERDILESQFS